MGTISRYAVVVGVVLAAAGAPEALAQTVTVSPGDLEGWTLSASAGTGDEPPPSTYLAPGYETPPAGDGSLHLNVGENGNDAAQARTNAFSGTRIADITALSYSTFTNVDVTGSAGDQAPYLLFHVDTDGDLGTADVQLWWFEPAYQSTPPAMDQWQTWDAHAGGWYTQGGLAGSGPGANVKTFTQLLTVAPDATIVSSGSGGVRIVTGFGAGAWDFYAGAADELRFATASSDVTYDFEPAATTLVTVTPSMLENWTLLTTDEGAPGGSPSSTIVSGPDTPPRPPGSLRLEAGTDGADAAEARSDRWDGLYLRDLAALSYSTWHESGGSGGQLPYLILRVDYDNDGDQDDLLFFEPAYQSSDFCGSNPQDEVDTGNWQTWDAAEGCWWSLNTTAGAGPGSDVKPLSTILAAQPDARLVTGATGGSFRVVAGFGAGAWDSFIGYADELRVLFDPETDTTYDFDPDPGITITGDSTLEPDAGTTPLTFGVALSHAVSYSVSVQYATSNGTATVADGDYASESGTVTFDPGDTSESITVDVNGDLKFEADESLFVDLSSPSGATLDNTQAEGLIGNDDPQPQIQIANVLLAEGDSGTTSFTFNVTLSNPSAQTITVDFATAEDEATAPSDFASVSGTLTFDPGETLQTIPVQVAGDNVHEDTEELFVNLDDAVNATISDAQATGGILNDDSTPIMTVEDVSVPESDGTMTFEVTLSNPSENVIEIQADTTEGSAAAGSDFTVLSEIRTFEPGDTVEVVEVTLVNDAEFEADERLAFSLNNEDPSVVEVRDRVAIGTIENDDAQPAISIGEAGITTESNGTMTFTVTLSHPSGVITTVDFVIVDGTATAPDDYAGAGGTLTFNPGDTTQLVVVTLVDDTTFEADETLTLELSDPVNATLADTEETGTIGNDDAQPTIMIGDRTRPEGDSGTTDFPFNVTLSNPSAFPVTVDYTTTNDTATAPSDFTAQSGTVTFNPGQISRTVTIVGNGDLVFEADERFFVDLSDPSGATIADGQGRGIIQDDDGRPTLSINDVTLEEGNDIGTPTLFTFVVTLSRASQGTVRVNCSTTTGGTATNDLEGTFVTLTFEPGQTEQPCTAEVDPDLFLEPDETFNMLLQAPFGATIADGNGLGTILNDDVEATVSIEDGRVVEGDSGQVEVELDVVLSHDPGMPVNVQWETADDTATSPADYLAESGREVQLTSSELRKTIRVKVRGEQAFEPDETFFVNITSVENAVVADGQGVATIENDDAEPPDEQPTMSIDNGSAFEGNGSADGVVELEVTLSQPSASPVTVLWSTAPNTATVADYSSRSNVQLVFAPGEVRKTITVGLVSDSIFEPEENFFVSLSDPDGATIGDGQGIAQIRNDDLPPVITVNDKTQDESLSNVIFSVSLSHDSAMPVTVDFATADGTAAAPDDYEATSGTLTFAPGERHLLLFVPVVTDTMLEPDETFFLNLSNPSGATIGDGQGMATLLDDDEVPTITISNDAEPEGTDLVFTVSLSNPRSTPVTVNFATANGTATRPDDYALTSGTLTFAPGDTEETITVTTVDDALFEGDETFVVNLGSASGATIADGQGEGTIEDDEAMPRVSIGEVSRNEGNSGFTELELLVALTGPSASPVTVDFETVDSSAVAPSDYVAASGTVTFAPGETTRTITLQVVGDTVPEARELFIVQLSNAVGATMGDTTGEVGIVNDDPPAISIEDVTELEGPHGPNTFAFLVTLSVPSADPVTVDFATAPGTASPLTGSPGPLADYHSTSGTLTFAPGSTGMKIGVTVHGDTFFELDETFFVNLSNPNGATIADGQGVGTILNDESLPTFSISDVSEQENGTFTFVVTVSGARETPVSVEFTTADGTAAAPDDYAAQSGTLVFLPQDNQQTITISVVNDGDPEPDETFFVNLSNAGGAMIVDGEGLGTILNDDGAEPGVADLTVTKTGPASIDVGQPLEYLITVRNLGPEAATNVVVTDTLPAGTAFVSANPSQGSCSGTTTITCNLGTINDGSSATIELVVTAPSGEGEISNTATADADQADATAAAATANTFVVGAAAHVAGIPTLSEWALMLMLMALAGVAAGRLRA